MRRKLFLSSMIVLLLAVVSSMSAFAMQGDVGPDGAPTRHRPRGVRGEIAAVAPDGMSFELLIKNGENLTFLVTDETRFRGQVETMADLEVGMPAAVGFKPQPDQGLMAYQVVVHEHLDRVGRLGGKIVEVNLEADTFDLAVHKRGILTFDTNETTRFQGSVSGLEDLTVNQVAQVAFVKPEDGNFNALLVFVPQRQPVQRFLGKVLSLETGADRFAIETRQGVIVNLEVEEGTKFRSPNGEINGLEDLEVGMPVAVGGVPQDGGTYLAKWIGATDQPLPKIPISVRGEVVDVGSGKFSVETRGGETLNFLVTEDTLFRSRGGEIEGLDDLAPGMQVGVGAEDIGEGVLQANVILVGK